MPNLTANQINLLYIDMYALARFTVEKLCTVRGGGGMFLVKERVRLPHVDVQEEVALLQPVHLLPHEIFHCKSRRFKNISTIFTVRLDRSCCKGSQHFGWPSIPSKMSFSIFQLKYSTSMHTWMTRTFHWLTMFFLPVLSFSLLFSTLPRVLPPPPKKKAGKNVVFSL